MPADNYAVSLNTVKHLDMADFQGPGSVRSGELQHVPHSQASAIRNSSINGHIYCGELAVLVNAGSIEDAKAFPGLLIGVADGAAAVTVVIAVLVLPKAVIP